MESGQSRQVPLSKFIGLRMERDSCQVFSGQETSFGFLWEISLLVLKFPEGSVRGSPFHILVPF